MKIALSPKPAALLQLCAYADALETIQGRLPEKLTIVTRNQKHHVYSTTQFIYFYRAFKQRYVDFHARFDPALAPLPLKGEGHRNWSILAKRVLHERDDVQLTARIRENHVEILRAHGVQTLSDLAKMPPANRPKDLAEDAARTLIHQASLQSRSPREGKPLYEVLEHPTGVRMGLAMLPDAHPMDLFFDMEGYPLLGENGLEYLYGAVERGQGKTRYHEHWANDPSQEAQAFQSFLTFAHSRWTQNPGMHIYHYGHYEPSTLKRLMGQHGQCERLIDELLRNEVFVDLYQVVIQGLRVGTHSYGLKSIERLYYPDRQTEIGSGADSAVAFSQFLETNDERFLDRIREYNQDDCYSTKDLESFLRRHKNEKGIAFAPLQQEEIEQREADPESLKEKCSAQARALIAELPPERCRFPLKKEDEADYIQELFAHLLDHHRREENPEWWEYFRKRDLSPEQLFDEPNSVAGARIIGMNEDGHRICEFDSKQEARFRAGSEVLILENGSPFEQLKIETWDLLKGRFTLSGEMTMTPTGSFTLCPARVFIRKDALLQSLLDQAQAFDRDAPLLGLRGSIHDLLLRKRPRIKGKTPGSPLLEGKRDALTEITDLALNMDQTCLCIQGPPGAGKTYTGSRVIAELLRRGKSVAISSNSHNAISNLLKGVDKACGSDRSYCRPVKLTSQNQMGTEQDDFADTDIPVKSNSTSLGVLFGSSRKPLFEAGPVNVVGATVYVLSKADYADRFDYLFVDEATQVCLANIVAMSGCAKNIVLLGDQMQLDQPLKATHPGDSGKSALVHMTAGKNVIEDDFGVFLPTTYRMHPDVNTVVSELFYEGALQSDSSTREHQILWHEDDSLALPSAGIHYLPVPHRGNSHGSEEEAEAIERVVALALKSRWRDKKGKTHPFSMKDILIVAPYNYQVSLLKARLGNEARVGSVDLFQGEEAPLVLFSLCASTPKDAPRGISFLLNRNRVNVALSRAQHLAIVVGSPELSTGKVSTIEGMKLLNVLCRITRPRKTAVVEVEKVVELEAEDA